MRSLLRRYGVTGAGLAIASLMAIAGTAIGTRLLTEVVSTEVYGEFRLAVGIGILIVGVVYQPVTAYAMRAYHDAPPSGTINDFVTDGRRAIGRLSLKVGALAIIGSLIVAVLVGDARMAAMGLIASLYASAMAAVGLEQGLLTTKGSVMTAASYRAVAAISLPGVAALAAVATGNSTIAMVLAQTALLLAAALFLRQFTPSGATTVRARTWIRNALPFALPLAAVGLAAWLLIFGDRYLLAALTNASEVGTYTAAYGLAAAPLGALGSLLPTMAYAPLYRAAASGSERTRRSISNRLLGLQALLVAAGVVAVVLLAPIAVRFVLAPDFRPGAVAIMRWVAIGIGFRTLSFALDLDAHSLARTRRVLVSYSVAAAVAIVLNLLLVPHLGALGAAQATAMSGVTYFVSMLIFSRSGGQQAAGR